MSKNTPYYLGLSHCFGIGPLRFIALKKHFGSVEKAYEASEKELEKVIPRHFAQSFIDFRSKFDPIEKLKELISKQIYVLSQDDDLFPKQLLNISDPPICLYVKGDLRKIDFANDFFIGVVGTRKPTSYGQQVAEKFVAELATAGFVIVSGMAMGIDTIAHQAAINSHGKTAAVLGCGVDIVYPQINYRLYQKIIKENGVVISEFPPGQFVKKGLFVARNRLISGLSKGVLVVEGAADSGALITARYAAEQGREVFAPPGPLTSNMSQAPNLLLKQGAKMVTSIEDILEEFNLKLIPKKKETISARLGPQEKIIYNFLSIEPRSVDEIVEKTSIAIDQVMKTLSLLEIDGIVEKNSEAKYQVK
jgi:DNA processing protein